MWLRSWSLFGFFAMAGGFVALFMGGTLLSLDPSIVAIQTPALVLVLTARSYLGLRSFHAGAEPTQGALIREGPYRLVRHPIYAGACLFVWAPAVASHTLPALALSALVTVGAVIRMLCEERVLAKRYPEYKRYACATKRIIPYVL